MTQIVLRGYLCGPGPSEGQCRYINLLVSIAGLSRKQSFRGGLRYLGPASSKGQGSGDRGIGTVAGRGNSGATADVANTHNRMAYVAVDSDDVGPSCFLGSYTDTDNLAAH
jgi:hypothetical protein